MSFFTPNKAISWLYNRILSHPMKLIVPSYQISSPHSRFPTLCHCSNKDARSFEKNLCSLLPLPPPMVLVDGVAEGALAWNCLGLGEEGASGLTPLSWCPPGEFGTVSSSLLPGGGSGTGGPATASYLGAGIRWGALAIFEACRGREGKRWCNLGS